MSRSRLLVATLFVVALALGAAAVAGWIYTRPVVDEDDLVELRTRAHAILDAPEIPSGTYAPPIRCGAFSIAPSWLPPPLRRGLPAEDAELEAACREGLRAAWDHELVGADVDVDDVVGGSASLVSRATAENAPERVLEETLRGVWVVDGIVRAGRLDVMNTGMLGLSGASLTNLHQVRALSPDEAARVRAMLVRIRERHPSRLARPELLVLGEADLEPPSDLERGSAREADWWVCANRRLESAERIAAFGCGASTARACHERMLAEADAVVRRESEPAPAWAALAPPRIRARRWTHCAALGPEIAEASRRALVGEMALTLLDEAIASSLDGNRPELAMARPIPTFEGEPFVRTLVGERDVQLTFPTVGLLPQAAMVRQPAEVHLEAPAWVGLGTSSTILTLYPSEAATAGTADPTRPDPPPADAAASD
ncbi:MAG: hypothetical protein J0L92_22495 [Deltaproteobacteria bacterium]|nr:hypothetical protein [Deltaproteobacteria bacterium]